MKIGFSFGRCIRDIVNGVVDFDDVLLIITRTRIEESDYLSGMIREYTWRNDYLEGLDEDHCLDVAVRLWESGKIHQPLMYGARLSHVSEKYLWMDVIPTATDMDPGLKEAWEAYRMLLVMRNTIPDGSGH